MQKRKRSQIKDYGHVDVRARAHAEFYTTMRRRLTRLNEYFEINHESERIWRSIRDHQVRLARPQVALTAVFPLLTLVLFIFEFVFFFGLFTQPQVFVHDPTAVPSAFAAAFLITFVLTSLLAGGRGRWTIRLSVVLGFSAAIIAVSSLWYIGPVQGPVWGIATGAMSAFAALIGVILWGVLVSRVSNEILGRLHPDSLFINKIAHACWITNDISRWNDLSYRREIVLTLEHAARVLADSFPRKIGAHDPRSAIWIRERAQQQAAALREYKRWVYSPELQTRTDLHTTLRRILHCAAIGEWGYLPRQEVETVTLSQFKTSLVHLLTAISRALLPLIALIIWYYSPWAPSKEGFERALVTTTAICAAYLLLSLDPGAESRVKGAGSVLGVFTKFPGA